MPVKSTTYANTRERVRATRGDDVARAYSSWTELRRRCRHANPARGDACYAGISVCDRWDDFENFLADMGVPLPGMSIDRIDSGKDYESGNCRWADATTQSRNRRIFVKLTEHDVVDVRWLYAQGLTQQKIAALYGVTQPMVGYVVRHANWA